MSITLLYYWYYGQLNHFQNFHPPDEDGSWICNAFSLLSKWSGICPSYFVRQSQMYQKNCLHEFRFKRACPRKTPVATNPICMHRTLNFDCCRVACISSCGESCCIGPFTGGSDVPQETFWRLGILLPILSLIPRTTREWLTDWRTPVNPLHWWSVLISFIFCLSLFSIRVTLGVAFSFLSRSAAARLMRLDKSAIISSSFVWCCINSRAASSITWSTLNSRMQQVTSRQHTGHIGFFFNHVSKQFEQKAWPQFAAVAYYSYIL